MYQVDAFASKLFEGNPAAVVLMKDDFISPEKMMNIAAENNLSETAFVLHQKENEYYIRWFTPNREHELCGHATLGSAHVLFFELDIPFKEIIFTTKFSGILKVEKLEDGLMRMNFPTQSFKKELVTEKERDIFRASLKNAYDKDEEKNVKGEVLGDLYWLIELESKKMVLECNPIQDQLIKVGKGLIVTSIDEDGEYDFVSRMFAPWYGIPEDPVTGSAHTLLSAYWYERFGKKKKLFKCKQVSKRTGELIVEYLDERTSIAGKAITYLRGGDIFF